MKKYTIIKIVSLAILNFMVLNGQSSAVDDVNLLLDTDDEIKTETKTFDKKDLNEIYGGKFFSNYTFSNFTTRHLESVSVYWEKKLNDIFSFKTEIRILNSQIETELEVTEQIGNESVKSEETDKLSSFEVEPRDFYLRFKQGNWQATIGWQTFTIGVGTLSSPLDFILIPDRTDSLPINLNRLEGKLAQPIVNLNYQNGGLDFTYYYHPFLVVDNFVKQQFEKEENEFAVNIPKVQRHLLRLLYRGDNFVTGFSFYKGINSKFFSKIHSVSLVEPSDDFGVTRPDIRFTDKKFSDTTLIAWEYAYTSNKWRYSLETVFAKGFIDELPQQGHSSDGNLYNNFIIANNGGKLFDDKGSLIALNIGFDYIGNRNVVNFYVTAIIPQLSSFAQEAVDLFDQESNDEHFTGENFVFVTLNYARFLNEEKTDIVGVALGNFSSTIGAGFYYKKQVNDNLSYGLTLGVVGYQLDEIIFEDDEDENKDRKLANPTPVILNFAMEYTF